jgi:L-ribulokinase
MMQIYADITGRQMKISRSEQTPALGAAIFASVAAGKGSGGYDALDDARKAMTGTGKVYVPREQNHETYKKLYTLYRQLHDGFGMKQWNGGMANVMKDLLAIRDDVLRTP